jgi:hypothetical protein
MDQGAAGARSEIGSPPLSPHAGWVISLLFASSFRSRKDSWSLSAYGNSLYAGYECLDAYGLIFDGSASGKHVVLINTEYGVITTFRLNTDAFSRFSLLTLVRIPEHRAEPTNILNWPTKFFS